MGGSASQPIVEAEEQNGGVFSLSSQMQQQLAQDFHEEQIVKLFGKQIEQMGERKAAVLQQSMEQRVQLEEKLNTFRKHNQQLQSNLDETLEGLEDKFTDISTAIDYDMDRLEKQYLGGKPTMFAPMTYCGQERSDIVACYQSSIANQRSDPFACDAFVKELAKCTEQTIVRSGGK
jgi:hypothetical protein